MGPVSWNTWTHSYRWDPLKSLSSPIAVLGRPAGIAQLVGGLVKNARVRVRISELPVVNCVWQLWWRNFLVPLLLLDWLDSRLLRHPHIAPWIFFGFFEIDLKNISRLFIDFFWESNLQHLFLSVFLPPSVLVPERMNSIVCSMPTRSVQQESLIWKIIIFWFFKSSTQRVIVLIEFFKC